MKKLKLLSYSKITAISSAVSALVSQGSAEAGIVYFDVNPDLQILGVSGEGAFGKIDLESKTYELGSKDGVYFSIPVFYGFSFKGNVIEALAKPYVTTYALVPLSKGVTISGDLITGESDFRTSGYGIYNSPDETTGPTYYPLRINWGAGNHNYGWVQVLAINSYDHIITGFAFEKDLNTPILAGDTGSPAAAVPEPGSLAVVSGLFGLVVAANRRSRKRNEPSAPDALLNLASGARGVQKLREDSAA